MPPAYNYNPTPSPTIRPPNTRPPSSKRKGLFRKHQSYIPRPPNAYILFRADFVRHGYASRDSSLARGTPTQIAAACWNALPSQEKSIWYEKATMAKQEHKVKYPDYRYNPVR
ncbi:high mobility group box domain-containing protein, partial [Mycena galericulata]